MKKHAQSHLFSDGESSSHHNNSQDLTTLQAQLEETQLKLQNKENEILQIIESAKKNESLIKQFESKLNEKNKQLEQNKQLHDELDKLKNDLNKSQEALNNKRKGTRGICP